MGDFNIYKVDNYWDEAFKSFTPFVDLEIYIHLSILNLIYTRIK